MVPYREDRTEGENSPVAKVTKLGFQSWCVEPKTSSVCSIKVNEFGVLSWFVEPEIKFRLQRNHVNF